MMTHRLLIDCINHRGSILKLIKWQVKYARPAFAKEYRSRLSCTLYKHAAVNLARWTYALHPHSHFRSTVRAAPNPICAALESTIIRDRVMDSVPDHTPACKCAQCVHDQHTAPTGFPVSLEVPKVRLTVL